MSAQPRPASLAHVLGKLRGTRPRCRECWPTCCATEVEQVAAKAAFSLGQVGGRRGRGGPGRGPGRPSAGGRATRPPGAWRPPRRLPRPAADRGARRDLGPDLVRELAAEALGAIGDVARRRVGPLAAAPGRPSPGPGRRCGSRRCWRWGSWTAKRPGGPSRAASEADSPRTTALRLPGPAARGGPSGRFADAVAPPPATNRAATGADHGVTAVGRARASAASAASRRAGRARRHGVEHLTMASRRRRPRPPARWPPGSASGPPRWPSASAAWARTSAVRVVERRDERGDRRLARGGAMAVVSASRCSGSPSPEAGAPVPDRLGVPGVGHRAVGLDGHVGVLVGHERDGQGLEVRQGRRLLLSTWAAVRRSSALDVAGRACRPGRVSSASRPACWTSAQVRSSRTQVDALHAAAGRGAHRGRLGLARPRRARARRAARRVPSEWSRVWMRVLHLGSCPLDAKP